MKQIKRTRVKHPNAIGYVSKGKNRRVESYEMLEQDNDILIRIKRLREDLGEGNFANISEERGVIVAEIGLKRETALELLLQFINIFEEELHQI